MNLFKRKWLAFIALSDFFEAGLLFSVKINNSEQKQPRNSSSLALGFTRSLCKLPEPCGSSFTVRSQSLSPTSGLGDNLTDRCLSVWPLRGVMMTTVNWVAFRILYKLNAFRISASQLHFRGFSVAATLTDWFGRPLWTSVAIALQTVCKTRRNERWLANASWTGGIRACNWINSQGQPWGITCL